ncbi:MAG: hypothetical protein ACR2K4_05860 [Candidatus Limnocylindria bacterium]
MTRASSILGASAPVKRESQRELPLALRRDPGAGAYLAAERDDDHPAAGAAATSALMDAMTRGDWWAADVWGHRSLWHYEKADMSIEAVRAARLIGDVRLEAGDPDSARRYYAEAVDEARDIGAEHEQGLASLGLGHALLERGEATTARRVASAAVVLLERSGAEAGQIEEARMLVGTEVRVGSHMKEIR